MVLEDIQDLVNAHVGLGLFGLGRRWLRQVGEHLVDALQLVEDVGGYGARELGQFCGVELGRGRIR